MGNPWIAQQRAQFATELAILSIHDEVCAMMITEDAVHPAPCFESLLNRTLYVNSHGQGKTLKQMIQGGFYGPYNRGMYPRTIAQLHNSPALQARMNAAIAGVMAGSDDIEGYTDQGLPSDPNGMRQPQLHLGGNIFNDWGGGPGGHDGAEAWRQTFENSALQAALKIVITGEAVDVIGILSDLEITGVYDAPTEAAVRLFQGQNPAAGGVDGIYGEKTRAAVNAKLTGVV